jgi:hypothetical protein
MYRVNNDIVNVVRTSNYNVNDNGNKYDKAKSVELIADRLLLQLNCQENSRPFLCKVAYKLSEAKIWDNVEQALKGRNPMGLFIYLCKRDGV